MKTSKESEAISVNMRVMRVLWASGIIGIFICFLSCTYQPIYQTVTSYTSIYSIELKQVERPAHAKERYGKHEIVRVEEKGVTKYSFEDELMSIFWMPTVSALYFVLNNKTDHSIKIIWDEAAYVDIDGISQRVMHAGVKYADRNNSQPPTVVVRKGTVTDLIVPSDKVDRGKYRMIPYIWAPNAEELKLKAEKHIGKNIEALLPLQIEDVVNEYIFIFEVQSIEIKQNKEEKITGYEWR